MMGIITHKMAKDKSIDDRSVMSVANSANQGAMYVPFLETDPITNIGHYIFGVSETTTHTGAAQGALPYTVKPEDGDEAPSGTGISSYAGITPDQDFVLFGMFDLSQNVFLSNDDTPLMSFSFGNMAAQGVGIDSTAGVVFKMFTDEAQTLTLDWPSTHVEHPAVLVAVHVTARDAEGKRAITAYMVDGTETDTEGVVVLAQKEITSSTGILDLSNNIKFPGVTFGTPFPLATYVFGLQIFTAEAPTTLLSDLMLLQERTLLGKKGLPANWVNEVA